MAKGAPVSRRPQAPDPESIEGQEPGSSRQQDALVGPLTDEQAMKVAKKKLRIYRFVQLVLRLPLRVVLRVKRHGLENIPKKSGAIIVCNHVSSFDPAVVVVSVPRPYITLAKAGILAKPVKRLFIETLGGNIRVDRSKRGNRAAVDAACLAVEQGKLLAVFPEGGRSPTGQLTRGHTGVARIAMKTGAPVLPTVVSGTYEMKAKNQKKIRWGTPLSIHYGKPLYFGDRAQEADDRQAAREVTDQIMLAVARMQGPEQAERYQRLIEADIPPNQLPPQETDHPPALEREQSSATPSR